MKMKKLLAEVVAQGGGVDDARSQGGPMKGPIYVSVGHLTGLQLFFFPPRSPRASYLLPRQCLQAGVQGIEAPEDLWVQLIKLF